MISHTKVLAIEVLNEIFLKKKKKKKSEKKLMENVKIFLRKKEKKKCGYYRERNKNLSED